MTEPVATITTEPGDPWFTGQVVVEGVDHTLPVSVDGRGFLLDRAASEVGAPAHSRRSINLVNTQNATSSEDATAVEPEVWRRIADSWHFGSGQARFDRPNAVPYRFADSHNVDVWSEWGLALLPATRQLRALGVGKALMSTVGPDRFVVVVGTTAYWWTSLDLPETSFALGVGAVDITSDGTALYVLDTSGTITRYSGPSAGTVVGTVPNFVPSRGFCSFAKGFIVASGNNDLYDMTSGSADLIYSHPLESFTWRDTAEGLAPAYLLGGVGDKWSVYAMAINDNATGFNPPVQAAPIPEGEIGYALASYLGYILIGTNAGWRFGFPAGDGTLTFGKLVETDSPVKCFEGQDRFVWYGKSSVNGSLAGLGRTDLSTFVAPMTPAYASDLSTDQIGDVDGVITFGSGVGVGKRVFAISGVGVFCEDDELAAEGWLEQGGMSFNSADPKMGLYVVVDHAPLVAGTQIAVDVKLDGGAWNEVTSQSLPDAVTTGKASLTQQFRVAYVRYRLTGAGSVGPQVERMELRALNVPGRATEFTLPILLRDMYQVDGSDVIRSAADDYQFLISRWESRREFTYREAGQTYSVHATDFDWLPEYENADGSAYEGTFVMTVKEIR
jgi:hypothetical protein